MSDQQDQAQQPDPQAGGFVDESANAAPEQEAPATGTKKGAAKKANKGAELKANFASVFGHGIGKFALIAAVLVVVVLVAFAMRGFNSKPAAGKDTAQVDVPGAPAAKVNIDPIDEREAQRRAEITAKEAEAASRKGQTYQPDFNPAVVANQAPQQGQPGYTQPQLNVADAQQARPGQPPVPPGTQPGQAPAPQQVPITVPAGQSSANGGAGVPNGQQAQQQANAQQQEEQRRQQAERDKQLAARDKYVDQLRGGVKDQVEELLGGKGKEGGIRGAGAYSIVSYLPKQQAPASGAAAAAGGDLSITPSTPSANKKPPIFKAGKAIFATLDSEVNTDDGGEVFATVHGGKYDGAKLIGKIEQAPRNIRLRFSILSPQDDRSSLTINAIAIREQDAKQGVAETIDNHTLERYTALFAGSILSGIGKAAMQPQGDTIVLPNGQVIVSQPELTNKRIAMYALGEVGINAGAEVRKSFSQPPTYITPANKGIGVIFLTDVNEK